MAFSRLFRGLVGAASGNDLRPCAIVGVMDVHPLCLPLEPLLGTWRGRGSGHYPTIEPFEYFEEVTFAHVGKPFVSYVQKTRHAATDLPAHAEAGYIRAIAEDTYEFVVSSPTGIVELSKVTLSAANGTDPHWVLEIVAQQIVRLPSAKLVTEVTRRLQIDGDTLHYDMSMAAVGEPLTHHLAADLLRVVG